MPAGKYKVDDTIFRQIKSLSEHFKQLDHFDVQTAEGEGSLPTFVANIFSFMPAWLRLLLGLRFIVAKLLGLKHNSLLKERRCDKVTSLIPCTPDIQINAA